MRRFRRDRNDRVRDGMEPSSPKAHEDDAGGFTVILTPSLRDSQSRNIKHGRGLSPQTGTVSTKADIYAVGGTLLFLFTGRRPYDGLNVQQVRRGRRAGCRQLEHKRVVSMLLVC
jgi:hypothetical protein